MGNLFLKIKTMLKMRIGVLLLIAILNFTVYAANLPDKIIDNTSEC